MSQRSFTGRRGNLTSLVSPALLLLLVQAAACDGQPIDPATTLQLEFPQRAQAVLGAGHGFARAGASFAAATVEPSVVELPGDGAGDIVFHGTDGFAVRVREIGAVGAGRVVDRAVAYARAGGVSFWTTAPRGAEEWLHLAAGRGAGRSHAGSRAAGPAAAWQVEGATVRTRGGAVELVGPGGVTRMRVTAPEAYAAGGRKVDVRLSGSGSTIELFVDGPDEAVLVDPLWKVVSPMSSPLADHRSAVVSSGMVLVSGGTDGLQQALDSAALYDPTADAWTDVGPMSVAHVCHTETALNDGTVIVAGGIDDSVFPSPQGNTDAFDENAATWSSVGYLNQPRMNHAAGLLNDGSVLVSGGIGLAEADAPDRSGIAKPNTTCWDYGGGGSGGPGATNSVEIYDPTTQMWTTVAYMNRSRERHTETVLLDGQVLVTGGESSGNADGDFEIYDPSLDVWNAPDNNQLAAPRVDHTATLLASGDVLLAGGFDGNSQVFSSAEIIAASGAQPGVAVGSMSTPRTHHTATLLQDGTVLVAGGTDGNSSLATAEIYDPVQQTWSPAPPMNDARSEHIASALAGGDVLVAGGIDDSDQPTAAAEVYVPSLPDGSPCTTAGQCKSTFCAEGVCCDSACGGAPCEACTTAQGATKNGTCTPLDGVICSESPCKVDGVCSGGSCTAAVPKACIPPDGCHESGVCDPASGICSLVAKLDGSDCDDGICIAGECIPDPQLGTTGSTSSGGGGATTGASTGSGTTTPGGGGGGSGGEGTVSAQLSGNGCSTGGPASGGAPAGLFAALLLAFRKRRRVPRR